MMMATEDPENSGAKTGARGSSTSVRSAPAMSKHDRERTCVGCGAKDAPEALVRLVQASKDSVVVDAAASSFGRGAHLHPRPDCLARACKGGLAKAFKSPIKANVATLASDMIEALERRVEGLLLAARRSGNAAAGTDAAIEAAGRGAPLLIVACDAGSVAAKHTVTNAIAEGRAVAWGTKERLGALFNKESRRTPRVTGDSPEEDKLLATGVALIAITGESFAAEILRATTAASGVEACRTSREVR